MLNLTIYEGKIGLHIICLSHRAKCRQRAVSPRALQLSDKNPREEEKNEQTHNSRRPFVLEVEVECGMTLHTVAVDLFFIAAAQWDDNSQEHAVAHAARLLPRSYTRREAAATAEEFQRGRKTVVFLEGPDAHGETIVFDVLLAARSEWWEPWVAWNANCGSEWRAEGLDSAATEQAKAVDRGSVFNPEEEEHLRSVSSCQRPHDQSLRLAACCSSAVILPLIVFSRT